VRPGLIGRKGGDGGGGVTRGDAGIAEGRPMLVAVRGGVGRAGGGCSDGASVD
jgi:hypothetical protein